MTLLHIRLSHSLLSLLAREREEQLLRRRLRADRPTGVVVRSRKRNRELQDDYARRCLQASGLTVVLLALAFLLYPERIPTVGTRTARVAVVNLEQIPETSQRARPPAAPRPVVPLAVEGDEVPDDVTIEPTDLDMDAIPIDLTLAGPGGALGPVSDEPMDISEIDYKPHLLTLIMPAFPDVARKEGIKEGEARVRLLVDKAGNVEKVEFLQGPEVFEQEAIETAYRYRFRPGRHQGEIRKVWMIVTITFRNR